MIKDHPYPEISPIKPQLPPPKYVFNRSYHYKPCSMSTEFPPLLNMRFLHVLFQPGYHSKCSWLNRLPKKLRTKMPHPDEETSDESLTDDTRLYGWGIEIEEGLNYMMMSIVTEFFALLSLAIVLVYGICKGDWSAAFGAGQYVVGCVAMVNGLGIVGVAAKISSFGL